MQLARVPQATSVGDANYCVMYSLPYRHILAGRDRTASTDFLQEFRVRYAYCSQAQVASHLMVINRWPQGFIVRVPP